MSNLDSIIPYVDVPEGQSSAWKISRFTTTEDEIRFFNMRCAFSSGGSRRAMKAGTFTRLTRGAEVIMSDTPAEKLDHLEPVRKAKGTILINGLGIGMVLNACLLKPEVQKAIVVEKSEDVLKLCAEHYHSKFGSRVEIVHADAYSFKPPKAVRFGMVWHDVWDAICSDNLPEMGKLHRRYGRLTEWQGSWAKELCRR